MRQHDWGSTVHTVIALQFIGITMRRVVQVWESELLICLGIIMLDYAAKCGPEDANRTTLGPE